MANFAGTLSSKEGFPLGKRTPRVLGPQRLRTLGATHLFSFPDLCAGEEKNTG